MGRVCFLLNTKAEIFIFELASGQKRSFLYAKIFFELFLGSLALLFHLSNDLSFLLLMQDFLNSLSGECGRWRGLPDRG